jgi:hypothetical protein
MTPKQELEQRECERRREKTSAPSQRLGSGIANGFNVEVQQANHSKHQVAKSLPPSELSKFVRKTGLELQHYHCIAA